MLTDQQYRLFVRVATSASFADAARQAGLSPAAITRGVAAMERALGVRLLSRTTRAMRLTDDGALFLVRAQDIVARMDEAEAELLHRKDSPSGTLCISAPLSFGRRHIAPILADFAHRFPAVNVQLCLSDVSDDLAIREVDLAIRVGLPEKGDYIARRILSARRVVCAAPDYLERHGTPMIPDDLARHRCLAVIRDDRPLDRWMFEVDGRMQTVRVPVALSSNSGEVVQGWAEAGLGIALKSLWDVGDALADGRLVTLLRDHARDRADIFAIYLDRRNLPSRTRCFLDFLTEALMPVEAAIGGE